MRYFIVGRQSCVAWVVLGISALLLWESPAIAQRRGSGGGGPGVYRSRIAANWSGDGQRFWYRNDLAGGKREFVLVDAKAGARQPAFDHEKLAAALVKVGVADASPDRLLIERLEFLAADNALLFRAGDKDWRCDLATYELTEVKDRPAAAQPAVAQPPGTGLRATGPRASRRTGEETELTFVNRTAGDVELFWLDMSGERRSYGKLPAGERKAQHTFGGHVWEVVAADGRSLGVVEAEDAAKTIEIGSNSEGTRFRSRRPAFAAAKRG